MARNASRLKLGYYPLPEVEAARIRQSLSFASATNAMDPCAGTGAALRVIADAAGCRRYGIELESGRAASAAAVLDQVIHGSTFETHCPVESISLLYLNPPYDDEIGDDFVRRTEGVFLEWCYRWLIPGGVLVMIIPGNRIGSCASILAAQFRDVHVYRLTAPEAERFQQVAICAVLRSRRERERLRDTEVNAIRTWLCDAGRDRGRLLPLRASGWPYAVPRCDEAPRLAYRGVPLDAVEDALPQSRAYKQAARVIFAPQVRIAGRPLTPLHEGHAGLLSCAGLMDGAFGRGRDRHLACWQARKIVDHFEEQNENGVITMRDRERFMQELTLIYADGRTAELSEESNAERTAKDGAP